MIIRLNVKNYNWLHVHSRDSNIVLQALAVVFKLLSPFETKYIVALLKLFDLTS
jgi:hypothetical protein